MHYLFEATCEYKNAIDNSMWYSYPFYVKYLESVNWLWHVDKGYSIISCDVMFLMFQVLLVICLIFQCISLLVNFPIKWCSFKLWNSGLFFRFMLLSPRICWSIILLLALDCSYKPHWYWAYVTAKGCDLVPSIWKLESKCLVFVLDFFFLVCQLTNVTTRYRQAQRSCVKNYKSFFACKHANSLLYMISFLNLIAC